MKIFVYKHSEIQLLMDCTLHVPHLAKEYDESSDHSTPDKCTYIVNREETDEEDDEIDEAENGEVRLEKKIHTFL